MKQYQLTKDYQGWPKDTPIFGPFQVIGGGMGYFRKEDIPTTPEGGNQCFFQSAVESNPDIFKLISE